MVDWDGIARGARDGIVPVEHATRCGVTDRTLRRWDAAGGPLIRLERRALVAATSAISWRARLRAAALQVGHDVVVSRSSAVRLHGIDVDDHVLHLTVPHGRRLPRLDQADRVRVHRTRTWDQFLEGVVDVAGLPTEPVSRAVAETAAWFWRRDRNDVRRSRRLVEAAVLSGRVSMADIVQAVVALGPVRGRHTMEEAIRSLDPAAVATGSPPQVELARALPEHGCPAPVLEHPVGLTGITYRLDLAWPDRRRAVEVDSVAHHLGTLKGTADNTRQWAIEDVEGWTIRRVYTWQIRDHLASVCRQITRFVTKDA